MLRCPECQNCWSDYYDASHCDCGFPIDLMEFSGYSEALDSPQGYWATRHETEGSDMDYRKLTSAEILLMGVLRGDIRWEWLTNSVTAGDVCVDGMRYLCRVDPKTNLPEIGSSLRKTLIDHYACKMVERSLSNAAPR